MFEMESKPWSFDDWPDRLGGRPRSRLALLAVVAACGACEATRKALPCAAPIPGLAPHLEQGHIVWFGEMHGTEESPRFVGDAVCEAAHLGRVQLGLEVWETEQGRLDRYVRSAG